MVTKDNTFKVDFNPMPQRPSPAYVIQFILEKIGVKKESLLKVQLMTTTAIAVVQIKESGEAIKIVDNHDGKHAVDYNGEKYFIPIKMEDNSTRVIIKNCTDQITNEEIKKAMMKFGEVKKVIDCVWEAPSPIAGIRDGNREVTIVIDTPIPSFVSIKGEKAHVQYNGQQRTCKYCELNMHLGMTCLQYKKTVTNNNEDEGTYANMVRKEGVKSSVQNRLQLERAVEGLNSGEKKQDNTLFKKPVNTIKERRVYESVEEAPSTSKANAQKRTGIVDSHTTTETEDESCMETETELKKLKGRPKKTKTLTQETKQDNNTN